MFLQTEEKVDRPKHYCRGKIQPDDFIADQDLNFRIGCVVKYCCRYKDKNGLEDLKKARWYLEKQIEMMEKEENETT